MTPHPGPNLQNLAINFQVISVTLQPSWFTHSPPSLFSEAACTPVSVSIIADLYPSDFRGAATGIFNWGIYFGYGFSYLVGVYGTKVDIFGLSWRFAYIVRDLC